MRIPPRQQSRTSRSAEGGAVEIGISKSLIGQAIEIRRFDQSAKGRDGPIANIVYQNPDDIGRVCRRFGISLWSLD
jgi:hypothetical protein